jgi:O-antigen/teichoic acid export membrane protein
MSTSPTAVGVPRHEISRAWRNTLKLGGSLFGTWTVALLVRFLLPRYVGPVRFGDLTFAEQIAAGFFVFTDLGIDVYAMKEVSVRPAHASEFFGGVLVARTVLSVAITGLLLGILAAEGKTPELILTAVAAGVTQIVVSLNGTLSTFLRACGRVDRLAIVSVVAKVLWGVSLGALLLAGGASGPLWILAFPLLLSELVKTATLFPATRAAMDLSFRVDVAATRRVLLASVPFFVSVIANSLGGRLNVWVLDSVTTDPREVGWYGATVNLSALAMVFTPLFGWIFLPLLSRARVRSLDEANALIRRALEAFLVVVIPVVLLIGLGADLCVKIAMGRQYAPAAVALQVMAMMTVLTYAAMILSMGLVALGKSWSLSFISVVSILIAPASAFLTVPLLGRWLGTGGQAAGAAVAATLAEIFVVIVSMIRIGWSVIDRRSIRSMAASGAAAIAVILLHRRLAFMGDARLAVDAAAYVVLALALGAVRFADVRYAIGVVRSARKDKEAPVAPPEAGIGPA